MIAFTSAKSRLMMPGTVMMSEIPCTAWRKMSSAMRKASKKLVPGSTVSINRSLGMTMTVSTALINSCSPFSACSMRRLPSNANGLVTTATLSAPSSLASEATTGAAPLPVPPPRPAVMKIMAEPSTASIIFSVSASAALRPTSGLAPAPSPLVSFAPSCSFTGACDSFSACKSVFAAMNSTPSSLARIMRFPALHPPPPTPMTLIFAGCSSSLKLSRMPVSLFMRPSFSPVPPSRRSGGFTTRRRRSARTRTVQDQTDNGRVLRLSRLFRHIGKAFRLGHAHRKLEILLSHLQQAVQFCAATGKNDARGDLFVESGALQIVAHQSQQFLGTRLDDVGERTDENGARRAVPDAGDLYGLVFLQESGSGAAMLALDALRFGNRGAQADGKVVG